MTASVVVIFILIFLAIIILAKTAVVVPQQAAYVVERLGRYSGSSKSFPGRSPHPASVHPDRLGRHVHRRGRLLHLQRRRMA